MRVTAVDREVYKGKLTRIWWLVGFWWWKREERRSTPTVLCWVTVRGRRLGDRSERLGQHASPPPRAEYLPLPVLSALNTVSVLSSQSLLWTNSSPHLSFPNFKLPWCWVHEVNLLIFCCETIIQQVHMCSCNRARLRHSSCFALILSPAHAPYSWVQLQEHRRPLINTLLD